MNCQPFGERLRNSPWALTRIRLARIMSKKLCGLLTCISIFGMPSLSSTTEVVDQEQLIGNEALASVGESGSIDATRGQSFTSGKSGLLTRIEVLVANRFNASDNGPVTVTLVSGESVFGSPSVVVTEISHAEIPIGSPSFVSADVSSQSIQVAPGDVFTVWLSSAAPDLNYVTWYGNCGNTAFDAYPSGRLFVSGNSYGNPDCDFAFRTFVDLQGPLLSCEGFASPLNDGAVTVQRKRVLPLKATLSDSSGQFIDDLGIPAWPVVEISFSDGISSAVDVTSEALPAGSASEGNQFKFLGGHWQFNLSTENFSAPGTYTITMHAGDGYEISPTCSAEFVIE